jgi:hypothetical protein
MLKHVRPTRVIEAGSGWSAAVPIDEAESVRGSAGCRERRPGGRLVLGLAVEVHPEAVPGRLAEAEPGSRWLRKVR